MDSKKYKLLKQVICTFVPSSFLPYTSLFASTYIICFITLKLSQDEFCSSSEYIPIYPLYSRVACITLNLNLKILKARRSPVVKDTANISDQSIVKSASYRLLQVDMLDGRIVTWGRMTFYFQPNESGYSCNKSTAASKF